MSLRRMAWEDIRRPQGIRESGDRPGIEWRIPSRRAIWAMCFSRRRHPVPSAPSPSGFAHSLNLISMPVPRGITRPQSVNDSCGR